MKNRDKKLEENNYKQYIIVIKPKAKRISTSKFGVHCAHASLAATLNTIEDHKPRFDIWYEGGNVQTKIVKEVKSQQKLKNLILKTRELGLPCAMIPDAGFTKELEKGEYIMGCIGPITESEARKIGIWRLSNYKETKISSYDELKNEFDKMVKKLRESCPHPDISDWITEQWGIGYNTGYKVKICNICKKEVDRYPKDKITPELKELSPKDNEEIIKRFMNRYRTEWNQLGEQNNLEFYKREIKRILEKWNYTDSDLFLQHAKDGTLLEAENDAIELKQLLFEKNKIINQLPEKEQNYKS